MCGLGFLLSTARATEDSSALHHCSEELVTWVPCPSKMMMGSGPGTMSDSINDGIFKVKSRTDTVCGPTGNSIFHYFAINY